MITVLFVDDEPIMCRGLANAIKWTSYDFVLVGNCSDGREALRKIEESHPDIVITDIRMPLMDGIELAKYINEHYKNTKVIILSGYDDFNYAKQAISYSVYEYLLKPIDNEELLQTLLRLRDSIYEERKQKKEQEEKDKELTCSLPALKEKVINQIVHSNIKSFNEYISLISLAHLNLQKQYFSVAAFYIPISRENNRQKNDFQLAAYDVASQVLNRYSIGECWTDNADKVFALFSTDKENDSLVLHIGEEILHQCKSKLKNDAVTGSISNQYSGYNNISIAFDEAKQILKYKIMVNSEQLIKAKELNVSNYKNKNPDILTLESELLFYIKCGEIKKAKDLLKSIFDSMKMYLNSPQYIESKCRELLIIIDEIIKEYNLNIILNIYYNIYSDFIYEFKDIDDIHNWFEMIIKRITEQIFIVNEKKYDGIIREVMIYLEKNYYKNITLNSVAEDLYINSSYLSYLFKQKTNKNFLEYLTELRIEKSKQLLENIHIKIYEIAQRVGYKDEHYFSQIFKKYTGWTPTDYRKRVK